MQIRRLAVLVLVSLVVVVPAGAKAGPRPDVPDASGFARLETGIWKGPVALCRQGMPPLRVAALWPRVDGRELVELAHRRPMTLMPALYGGYRDTRGRTFGEPPEKVWLGMRTQPEAPELALDYVVGALERALESNPDILLVHPRGWTMAPEALRARVLKAVEAGLPVLIAAGVRIDKDLREQVKARAAGNPRVVTLPMLEHPTLKCRLLSYPVGKGQVAFLTWGKPIRASLVHSRRDMLLHELSTIGSVAAIEALARRQPARHVVSVTFKDKPDWSAGPTELGSMVLEGPASDASMTVMLLDARGEVLDTHSTQVKLDKGRSTVPVMMPSAPAEPLAVVVRVDPEDGLDGGFAVGSVHPQSAVTLSVKPSASPWLPDQPVTGTVTVEGGRGQSLVVEMVDRRGNVLSRQEMLVRHRECPFELKHPLPLTDRWQQVRARLLKDGQAMVRASAEVYRDAPYRFETFRLFTWGGFDDSFEYRRDVLGQNATLIPGLRPVYLEQAHRLGADLMCMTHSFFGKGRRTLQDMFDEKAIEEKRSKLRDDLLEYKKLGGAWTYSYGDELFFWPFAGPRRDMTTPEFRGAFKAWLNQRYDGDINNLNRAWGTRAESFEALAIPEDVHVPREPMAPYVDVSMFLNHLFTEYFRELGRVGRQADPEAALGPDGMEQFSPFDGVDFDRLGQVVDLNIFYMHIDHPNKIYSWRAGGDFLKPRTHSGYWIAYDSDLVPPVARQMPWKSLFYGMNSLGFFQSYSTGDPYSALYPDWRPRPAFAEVCRSVRAITSGIDRLVLGSARRHDPIAVHYSPRSFALQFPASGAKDHINELGLSGVHRVFRPGYRGSVSGEGSAFLQVLTDLGYQPRMVSTRQIEAGALKDYKVLVLPFSQSLTDAEVKAITDWVKAGGLLVADYHAGIRDGAGNLIKGKGSLDELFGIRRVDTEVKHQSAIVSGYVRMKGRTSFGAAARLETVLTGGRIEVLPGADGAEPDKRSVGEARDGSPVMVTGAVGEGGVVYLNMGIESYLADRPVGRGGPLRRLLGGVFENFGRVAPPIKLVGKPGFDGVAYHAALPEPAVETTVFADGENRYVGMIWDWRRKGRQRHDVTARFARPRYQYDVINGRYLGWGSTVEMTVDDCDVRLLARLPYRVESIKADGAPTACRRGSVLEVPLALVVEDGPVGRHVFDVTVVAHEQGRQLLHTQLEAPAGQATVRWFVPMNLEPGTYRLVAQDVVSGCRVTNQFRVTE